MNLYEMILVVMVIGTFLYMAIELHIQKSMDKDLKIALDVRWILDELNMLNIPVQAKKQLLYVKINDLARKENVSRRKIERVVKKYF